MTGFWYFLWLSNIHCICVPHIFNHSCIHLGCVNIWAIRNKDVTNIGVHMYFQMTDFVFFRWISRSGNPWSYGISVFSFLRNLLIAFHNGWTNLIYIPINSVRGFPFLRILTNTCYFLSCWCWPFWLVWGDIWLWFWLAFPWWLVMSSTFSRTCWPSVCLYVFFEKISTQSSSSRWTLETFCQVKNVSVGI